MPSGYSMRRMTPCGARKMPVTRRCAGPLPTKRLRGRADQRRSADRRDPQRRRSGLCGMDPDLAGRVGRVRAPQLAVRSAFVEDSAAAVPTARAGSAVSAKASPRGHADPGSAGGPRSNEGRPALHRAGAEGADHARGRSHPGAAPQLPWIRRGHPDPALRSLVHPGSRPGCVGDGLQPAALSLDPRKQGDYYASTIGTYDRWAIQYGYTPLGGEPRYRWRRAPRLSHRSGPGCGVKALRSIAAEAADPSHLYGTDEDAGFGGLGLDPTVSRYDQTNDPLGWARERVTLINGLFDSLPTRMVAPGQGYARLRAAFTDLLNDRWYAILVTTKYLGGATTARDHRGDPSARPAFVTVPAAVQRRALAFIAEAGFGERAYRFRPELLSHLGPDRWRHWGSSPGADGRIDFPLHNWAMTQQSALLNQLLDPAVLSRVRDAELRVMGPDSTVTIPELFATLTAAIWTEVGYPTSDGKPPVAARNITSVRRDLQRLYLNNMIRMIVNPLPDTPEDARTLARVTLTDLATQLDRARTQRAGRLHPGAPDGFARADHPGSQRANVPERRNDKVTIMLIALFRTLPAGADRRIHGGRIPRVRSARATRRMAARLGNDPQHLESALPRLSAVMFLPNENTAARPGTPGSGSPQGLSGCRRGGRARSRDPGRRVLWPAGTQRRRQNHHDRDLRGAQHPGWRRGAGARPSLGRGRPGAAGAAWHFPAGNPVLRKAHGRGDGAGCSAASIARVPPLQT